MGFFIAGYMISFLFPLKNYKISSKFPIQKACAALLNNKKYVMSIKIKSMPIKINGKSLFYKPFAYCYPQLIWLYF